MKKALSLILALIVAVGVAVVPVSAATTKSVLMVTGTGGYKNTFDNKCYGQGIAEKCITVKKAKTASVYAVANPIWSSDNKLISVMKDYLRFSVWVYDVNTGVRVNTAVVKAGQKYQLPVDKNKNRTYSVQFRAYMEKGVWTQTKKRVSLSDVNWFLMYSSFYLVY